MQTGVALCGGLCAFCFAMLIVDLLQNIEVEKQERTDEYKKIPIFFRMFMPFASNMVPLLRSGSMREIVQKAQTKIVMGGYDLALTGEQFVAIRILLMIAAMIAALLMTIGGQSMNAVILLLIAFIYPTTWLNGVIRRRHLEILKALPNVLDLLTLSVEAGKDFLSALRDIVMRRKPDAIGEELRRALHEIQLGKPRQEALREMGDRVRQPDLMTILNAIVQAEDLGVSIGQLLRVQGDQLRSKRFSRAEKLANEAPVKILFPVVVFIFPAVFLVLMGPLLSQALKSFGG